MLYSTLFDIYSLTLPHQDILFLNNINIKVCCSKHILYQIDDCSNLKREKKKENVRNIYILNTQ